MSDTPRKKCFVIAPIGDDSTTEKRQIKEHSDNVLDFIINPVITQLGFEEGKRADHLGIPGDINRQIIVRIANDDLVIADLTGHNPNVFYELALRHAVRRPYIHLIKKGQNIPFDLAPKRTVFIEPEKIREVERAKVDLKVQVETCMAKGFVVESPLSEALNYDRLNEGDATARSIAVLMGQVEWLVQQEKGRELATVRSRAATLAALGHGAALLELGLEGRDPKPAVNLVGRWASVREQAIQLTQQYAEGMTGSELSPDALETILLAVRKEYKEQGYVGLAGIIETQVASFARSGKDR